MITVYKRKNIPKNMQLVDFNDIFFNKYTADLLDDRAREIIAKIDHSEMVNKYTVKSRFDGLALNIDKISTGCKTVLNIMYHSDKIFDIRECGENALDVIYALDSGNVYCEYPLISFEMEAVSIYEKTGKRVVDSYDELKEWWSNEN